MKLLRKFAAVVLSVFLLSALPLTAFAETGNDSADGSANSKIEVIDEIVTSYNNPNGRILCVASLGNPRLYPENSIEGINSAISLGADIVTVSIQKTKDDKLVLMTDNSLGRMCVNKEDGTAATTKVSENTLSELQTEFYLREGRGGTDSKSTKYTIPSLEEAIAACKGKIMLMINNGWDYAEEINALARSLEVCDIVIIRNAPSAELAAAFIDKAGVPICHVATHFDKDSESGAKSFVSDSLQTGVKMVELEAEKSYSTIFNNSVLSRFGGAGRAFISTTSPELCGGREDLIADWTDLIERGYNVIETDYAKELVNYIKEVETYRAELTSLITQAQGLNTSKYTKESAKNLSAALTQAEEISSIGAVSLNTIDKARYDIQEAIDALAVKTGDEDSSLPTWAIVLIVILCLILLPVIVIFTLRYINKRKAKKKKLARFKDSFKNEAPDANNHLEGLGDDETESFDSDESTDEAENAENETDSAKDLADNTKDDSEN